MLSVSSVVSFMALSSLRDVWKLVSSLVRLCDQCEIIIPRDLDKCFMIAWISQQQQEVTASSSQSVCLVSCYLDDFSLILSPSTETNIFFLKLLWESTLLVFLHASFSLV